MKNRHLLFSVFCAALLPTGGFADNLPCRERVRADEVVVSQHSMPIVEATEKDVATRKTSTAEAISSTSPQERASLLALLNSGSETDLKKIHGIAESKARTIIQSRPIFELDELLLLKGFGPSTVIQVLAYGEESLK